MFRECRRRFGRGEGFFGAKGRFVIRTSLLAFSCRVTYNGAPKLANVVNINAILFATFSATLQTALLVTILIAICSVTSQATCTFSSSLTTVVPTTIETSSTSVASLHTVFSLACQITLPIVIVANVRAHSSCTFQATISLIASLRTVSSIAF